MTILRAHLRRRGAHAMARPYDDTKRLLFIRLRSSIYTARANLHLLSSAPDLERSQRTSAVEHSTDCPLITARPGPARARHPGPARAVTGTGTRPAAATRHPGAVINERMAWVPLKGYPGITLYWNSLPSSYRDTHHLQFRPLLYSKLYSTIRTKYELKTRYYNITILVPI